MENKMTGYSFIDKPWLKNYQSNILKEANGLKLNK